MQNPPGFHYFPLIRIRLIESQVEEFPRIGTPSPSSDFYPVGEDRKSWEMRQGRVGSRGLPRVLGAFESKSHFENRRTPVPQQRSSASVHLLRYRFGLRRIGKKKKEHCSMQEKQYKVLFSDGKSVKKVERVQSAFYFIVVN